MLKSLIKIKALDLSKGIYISNDSPEPWGIGFQDGVTPGL